MCGNHPLCGVRCVWPQRSEGSDCLLKTQVRAKTLQVEVYGLTPARCWKVKRNHQPSGEVVNLSPSKRRW